jgi:glutamyl-tRNA synthetase
MTSHPHHSHADHPKRPEGQVVTRFAPSPTGYMHVGGVRTALFAWLYARKFGKGAKTEKAGKDDGHPGGIFILRSEDTDKEREVEGSMDHIIESLRWLGLEWDEGPDIGGDYGPYVQSERLDTYRKFAQILIDKKLAYADPYTHDELDAFRKKAEEEKRPFLYRDHRPGDAADGIDQLPAWVDRDGERKPLRLLITDEMLAAKTEWHDLVRGNLSAGPEALDDFILIKSDGYPTYNFAHIIDDHLMGVTHITRADEFISSTPKFMALYDALGIPKPMIASLPPIMSPDGKKKLGKRDGAKDILAYRDEGFLPEAMMNFLAFIGWNPGDEREIMSKEELIAAFDFAHVQNAGGKLNEDKLVWTNREYLTRMSDEEWIGKFQAWMHSYSEKTRQLVADRGFDKEKFDTILVEVVRERLSYFGEIIPMIENGELDYYFRAPLDNPEGADIGDPERIRKLLICPEKMWKNGTGEKITVDATSTSSILNQVGEILEKHADVWDKDNIKEALWPFAEHEGRGVVLWPLRVALSGVEKSPDPFALAGLLGKEETLARVRAAIGLLDG